jgi:hypothetical protein
MEQKDKLYCISSGASATSEIERDAMLVEAFGADTKVDVTSERLENHEKFFDPIKRLNLKERGRLVRTVSPIFNTVWPFAILIVQVIC